MTEPATVMPNVSEMTQFLDVLFMARSSGDELIEIRPLNGKGGALRPEWFSDVTKCVEYAQRSSANGDNVYVGALPRVRRSGKATDTGARVALWADIDCGTVGHKTAAYATKEAAMEAINLLGIEPTMIVDSGGGYHVWYILDQPAHNDAWSKAIDRLVFNLNADTNAVDLPRILRVPGTFNHKTNPPRPATLVALNASRPTIDQFLALPSPPEEEIEDEGDRPSWVVRIPSADGGDRPFDRANNVPVEQILSFVGTKTRQIGARTFCCCPVHRGHHDDQCIVGGKTNTIYCFADCRQYFSPVDIVASVFNMQPRDAVNAIARRFGFEGFPENRTSAVPTPPGSAPKLAIVSRNTDWKNQLAPDAKGRPIKSASNIGHIVRSMWGSRLGYNEMSLRYELDNAPLGDGEVARFRELIDHEVGVTFPKELITDAVIVACEERKRHPLRDYLTKLEWDGVNRIERVAPDILGIDGGGLTGRILTKWFVSAVARALRAGSKVDTALVLTGPQGKRKSTFFATLGGEWFVDSYMDITSADGKLQLHSAWIYEWAEIENITGRKHASDVKAFLSSQSDTFRVPYGRSVGTHPRSTVIVGTTNQDEFLNDTTGSRRFWVVQVPGASEINISLLAEWRNQLWAEAVVALNAGERWWLEKGEDEAREQDAARYVVGDPWEDLIANWLESPEGKMRIRQPRDLTTSTLLTDALKLASREMNNAAMNRVGAVMASLGYKNKQPGGNARCRSRYWVRDSSAENERESHGDTPF